MSQKAIYLFRTDFKDYSLQSRLHFRIHAAQNDLRSRDKAARKAANGSAEATPEADDVLPMSSGSNGLPYPVNEEEAAKILQGKWVFLQLSRIPSAPGFHASLCSAEMLLRYVPTAYRIRRLC